MDRTLNELTGGAVKQRGIYSEQIGSSTHQTRMEASAGPAQLSVDSKMSVQRAPLARSFKAAPVASVISPLASASRSSNQHAVEPKVHASHKMVPGHAPRRIEIERKKRLFASLNIEDLLREQHVDYTRYNDATDHQSGQASYLPLELFDNTTFEVREPEEWIRLGTVDGVCAVPAHVLTFPEGQSGKWVACTVTSYDSQTLRYTCDVPTVDPSTMNTIRLNLMFDAEDPAQFAKRVAAAHDSRRKFEAYIRYSLYVDSMPIDEMQPLDNEQTARILSSALNSKALHSNALDTAPLLNEVNIDYARTMNKIIFDMNLKEPAYAALKAQLALPPPEKRPYRYRGTIPTAPGASTSPDFQKTYAEFCFSAFITKTEIVNALIKVNSECLRASKMALFNTQIPDRKSVV